MGWEHYCHLLLEVSSWVVELVEDGVVVGEVGVEFVVVSFVVVSCFGSSWNCVYLCDCDGN